MVLYLLLGGNEEVFISIKERDFYVRNRFSVDQGQNHHKSLEDSDLQ